MVTVELTVVDAVEVNELRIVELIDDVMVDDCVAVADELIDDDAVELALVVTELCAVLVKVDDMDDDKVDDGVEVAVDASQFEGNFPLLFCCSALLRAASILARYMLIEADKTTWTCPEPESTSLQLKRWPLAGVDSRAKSSTTCDRIGNAVSQMSSFAGTSAPSTVTALPVHVKYADGTLASAPAQAATKRPRPRACRGQSYGLDRATNVWRLPCPPPVNMISILAWSIVVTVVDAVLLTDDVTELEPLVENVVNPVVLCVLDSVVVCVTVPVEL